MPYYAINPPSISKTKCLRLVSLIICSLKTLMSSSVKLLPESFINNYVSYFNISLVIIENSFKLLTYKGIHKWKSQTIFLRTLPFDLTEVINLSRPLTHVSNNLSTFDN